MKKLATFLLVICALQSNAQIFWTENFEGGSTSGLLVTAYTGPNGTWTQTITGTEAANPNPWYVSCAENGHTAGICGTGCAPVTSTATLSSLHVGSENGTALGDMGDIGASYDAGGICGFPGAACVTTDRRAESPTINCTGKYTITMRFYYIMDGQAGVDYATVWYYDGTTWSVLATPAQTPPICPGSQGLWTAYSVALPTSANNNANVKIGFEWKNNDDGIGTDPSFAVDSVNLSTPSGSLSASFTAADSVACQGSCITFTNTSTGSATGYTWTCSSGYTSTASTASPVTICFSVAGVYTTTLTAVGTGGTSTVAHTVTINPAPAAITGANSVCVGYIDPLADATAGGAWSASNAHATLGTAGMVTGVSAGVDTIYYALSTGCKADFIVTVDPLPCTTGLPGTPGAYELAIYPNPATSSLTVQADPSAYRSYAITNQLGQALMKGDINLAHTQLDISPLPPGLYYIIVKGDNGYVARKFVKE